MLGLSGSVRRQAARDWGSLIRVGTRPRKARHLALGKISFRSYRSDPILTVTLHRTSLCHAWDDRQGAAKELCDLLTARNVSVWFSENDIGLGEPFIRAIDKGLAKS